MRKYFFLVTYDIRDDKRRLKVFKIMRNFGNRVQFSVFECLLNEENLKRMIAKVNKEIEEEEDSVRIYYIPEKAKDKIRILGVGEVIHDQKFFVV